MRKGMVFALVILYMAPGILGVTNDLQYSGISRSGNHYKYSPARLDDFMSTISSSVSEQTIGRTQDGNDLYFFNYGDNSARKIIYIARQHGDEMASSFMAEGFVFQGLNDKAFLDSHKVYVVPMANPDGSDEVTRENAKDQDLNRCWNKDNCAEISKIRPKLDSLSNVRATIDNHALDSGEKYSFIKISSKQALDETAICSKMNKYLPDFECQFEQCNGADSARGHFCRKGVKYSILVEVSQANSKHTPAYTYKLGQNLEKFVKNLP